MNALCDALRDAVDPHAYIARVRRRGVLGRLAPGLVPAIVPSRGAALELDGLTVAIDTPAGTIHPVRDVSLRVMPRETLALVGESGSGKSLTGLAVMGLLPAAARVESGAALGGGARCAASRRGGAAPAARRRLSRWSSRTR